jgi:hypothetical protein
VVARLSGEGGVTDVPFARPGHLVTENEDRRRVRVEEVSA